MTQTDWTEEPGVERAEGTGPPPACPMAAMCKGMMDKKGKMGFWPLLPGALLIVVGALVLIKPAILVWLLGITSIVLGIMALMMAAAMRRWSAP